MKLSLIFHLIECTTFSASRQVFFSVLVGALAIGTAGPNFQLFSTARGAAHKIFQIIDTVSIHLFEC